MSDAVAIPGQGDIVRATWGTVALDDIEYPVRGQVAVTDLGVFPPKTTIGDHTKNSNDILSTFTFSDPSGGGQIDEMNEGTDLARFWDNVCEWRYPNMMGSAPQTVLTRPDGVPDDVVARVLGDIGSRLYVAWGTVPYAFDKANRVWLTAQAALAAVPINKPVSYDGWTYIPMGAASPGYQRVQESGSGTLAAYQSGPGGGGLIKAVSFSVWADRLIALESDGQISVTIDGTTWDKQSYTSTRKVRVDKTKKPKHLVPFFDRGGAPNTMIVTDREVLAYDPEVPKVWPTPFSFPPHPDVGLGAAVWRPGEDMFVSAGTEIHRWTSQNLRVEGAGLNRNHGLPFELRGRVIDLCAEQHGLYAVLQGNTRATAVPTWLEDGGDDDDPYFPDGTALSSLYVNNGQGWGCLWRSKAPTTEATWAMVSAVDDGYDLWWGVDNDVCTMRLRREHLNPLQAWRAQEDYFEVEGSFLETGWFDAAMEGFPKLAVRAIINAEHASPGDRIRVKFKLSPTEDWRTLGTAVKTDETSIGFGYDETGFVEGMYFNRIKFRFEFEGANEKMSPFMDSFSLQYQKMPSDLRAYQFTVPLPSEEWQGRSGKEIDDDLRALKNAPRMFRGVIGDLSRERPLQLRLAGITGDNNPGTDYSGLRVVNVIDLSDDRDYEYWLALQESLDQGVMP